MPGPGTRRTLQTAALVALLGLAAAAVAAAATPSRQRAHRLSLDAQRLDSRAHLALLDLYALDAQLHAARVRVGGLEAEAAQLRRQRLSLRAELAAARTTLVASQQDLALHLRSLYERGTVDPIAVVLGSTSLQDAVGRLDALTSVARQNRQVLEATAGARRRLRDAQARLGRERLRLVHALQSARDGEQALESARNDRVAYIGRLHAQARFRRAQVSALVAQAQRIQQKAQTLQPPPQPPQGSGSGGGGGNGGGASGADPGPDPPSGGTKMVVSATCYDLPGHTASGMPVGWGVVAVDPSLIPLGTKLYVPGYGAAVAADVGSGIKGRRIDLWMPYARCMQWGRRTVTITVF